MSKGWNFSSGDWLILCDSCAKKIRASKSKQRWDGFIVCADCWEPRHSMDFIRARADKISVPFTRPQPVDTFVYVDDIFLYVDGEYVDTGYAWEGQAQYYYIYDYIKYNYIAEEHI